MDLTNSRRRWVSRDALPRAAIGLCGLWAKKGLPLLGGLAGAEGLDSRARSVRLGSDGPLDRHSLPRLRVLLRAAIGLGGLRTKKDLPLLGGWLPTQDLIQFRGIAWGKSFEISHLLSDVPQKQKLPVFTGRNLLLRFMRQ